MENQGMSDAVATFISFTGAAPDQAELYLEMAGGDVEEAVGIFFSSQDGGGPVAMDADAMAPVVDEPAARSSPVPSWWRTIWPSEEPPPAAWREQALDCGDGGWRGGIPQPKNGPCGVLAVVHGLLLADQHTKEPSEIVITSEALGDVLTSILARCRPSETSPVRLVQPRQRGQYGPSDELEEAEFSDMASVSTEIQRRIDRFRSPGGVIDLLYSAVQTRGVDLIRTEAESEGGELPLVTRAFDCWLCTTELISLLLRGTANGNVGAFNERGEPNSSWDGVPIGLLSTSSKETGIPVAEALASPRNPVWILHGGSHFTVAWAHAMPPKDAGAEFTLWHWNGLPPGGPRLAELTVQAVRGTQAASQEVPKFYKPEPGEVDDVVQADPNDKKARPDEYRSWHFEVFLAWDDPAVSGEPRPADVPAEPKFDQEDPRYQRAGPWRCRLCYAKRFQTMDFSLVPADSPDVCNKCGKPRKECGWSLWVPFADLPAKFQASIMGRHAKTIETILWTRWPEAAVAAKEGKLPDA